MQAGEGEGESDTMFANSSNAGRAAPRGTFASLSRGGAGAGVGGGGRSKGAFLLAVALIIGGILGG